MPLPLPYVERIHQRLMVRYGSAWSAKWIGVDQQAIQADWAEQLHGMTPESIRAALAKLPDDFPPTATAFRKLGESSAPPSAREVLRLQDERAGVAPRADVVAMLNRLAERTRSADMASREWAVRLRQREESGEKLSAVQREAWRKALLVAQPAVADGDGQ